MTSKKILSCILAAAMAVSTFPAITANADTPTPTPEPISITNTGSNGKGLTITLKIDYKTATASDFNFTAPTNLVYNGSNKTASVTSDKTGMGAITVGYYSDENCTTTAVPKNVGTYHVGITLAKGANYNASSSVIHDSSWTFKITKATPNAPAAPTATSDNITKNSIKLTAVTDCEYSIDGTNYQDSPEFTGLTPGMEYTFYQRIKASNNTNQSVASEGAKIRTAPDTYGLNITLKIGESKVASGNAYVGQKDSINIKQLIGSGTVSPITNANITDSESILDKENGNFQVTLNTDKSSNEYGKLEYKFFNDDYKANKTATVRIPVSGNGDQYAIVVTLTMLKTPNKENTNKTDDTVKWDTPADTESQSENNVVVKSDASNNVIPVVDANNNISLSGEGTLTVDNKDSNTNNDVELKSVSGGEIKVNTNTNVYDAITMEGDGCKYKIGANEEKTLTDKEVLTVSYNGLHAKVENKDTKQVTFLNSSNTATASLEGYDALRDAFDTTHSDSIDDASEVKVNAVEIVGSVDDSNINHYLNDNEKSGVNAISGEKQIMSVNVWATNENGKTEYLPHIKLKGNKKIKLRIPIQVIANAVLRHINKDTGELEYVKSKVTNANGQNYIETKSDKLSSWIYTPATGLAITKAACANGSFKVKVNGVETLTANSGDIITIEDEPATGYKLSSLKFEGDVSGATLITSSKTFKMPGEDVTVTATFTKQSSGGGSYIDYTYKVIDGVGYRIHPSYVGVYEGDKDIEDMVIKSEIEGKPVTTIEAGAFNSFKKMKSITLPDTLTTIEQGAFWGCAALEEIDIPESVTSIGSNAFAYCQSLKKVIVRNKDCTIAMYNNTLYNDYKSNKYVYDGVVVGYRDSTAEKYADKYSYTFEDIEKTEVPVSTVLGKAKAPTVDSDGTVHWTAVENAVKYRIVKQYNGNTYTGKETTELSYKQSNVPDVEYKVFIRAFDKNDKYTDGEALVVYPAVGKAKAPTVDEQGVVHWEAVKNAVKYQIVKEHNGNTFVGKETTEVSYKQNYVPTVEYKVYIRSFGKGGNYTDGEVLTVNSGVSLDKAKAPTVDDKGVVTWESVKNAVKYKVYKIVNGVYYGGEEVTDTAYTFRSVPVSDYQVYVVAYGENGAKTIGEKATVKVDKPLGFVNDTKVSADGKVTWSKAKNATSYRVVKVINGKKYYGAETKTNSYKFEKLPYKDYQVYVIAYGADNKLTVGKRVTVEVGDLGVVLDTKVDKNGKVTWKAVRNAVKYKVGKVVGDKTYYTGEITNGTSTTISVPESDYKIFVVAFDKDGNKTWGWKKNIKVDQDIIILHSSSS